MDIRPVYPDDIAGECRNYAASIESERGQRIVRLSALAVADLVDALQAEPGPTKWVRMSHFQTLTFFAFDQREFPRQHWQLIVECGPFGKEYPTEVRYRLPVEHHPWKWAIANGRNVTDVVKLVLDGLSRCESRREHLMPEEPR